MHDYFFPLPILVIVQSNSAFRQNLNRGREGKTAALYLGVTGFKSRYEVLLSWLRLHVDIRSFSGHIQALKLGQHRLFLQPFQFIIE